MPSYTAQFLEQDKREFTDAELLAYLRTNNDELLQLCREMTAKAVGWHTPSRAFDFTVPEHFLAIAKTTVEEIFGIANKGGVESELKALEAKLKTYAPFLVLSIWKILDSQDLPFMSYILPTVCEAYETLHGKTYTDAQIVEFFKDYPMYREMTVFGLKMAPGNELRRRLSDQAKETYGAQVEALYPKALTAVQKQDVRALKAVIAELRLLGPHAVWIFCAHCGRHRDTSKAHEDLDNTAHHVLKKDLQKAQDAMDQQVKRLDDAMKDEQSKASGTPV